MGEYAVKEGGGKGGKGGKGESGGKGGKGAATGGRGGDIVKTDNRDPLTIHLERRKDLGEINDWFPKLSEKARRSLMVVNEQVLPLHLLRSKPSS
jgi:hypothetical protein